MGRAGGRGVSGFGSLQPFRGEFKSPRNDKGDWKADDNQENNQPNDPIRDLEEWKDLRRYLDEEPTDHRICDGDFVNIASLQFREKNLQIQRLVSKASFIQGSLLGKYQRAVKFGTG